VFDYVLGGKGTMVPAGGSYYNKSRTVGSVTKANEAVTATRSYAWWVSGLHDPVPRFTPLPRSHRHLMRLAPKSQLVTAGVPLLERPPCVLVTATLPPLPPHHSDNGLDGLDDDPDDK
jgi:hypothetical protein